MTLLSDLRAKHVERRAKLFPPKPPQVLARREPKRKPRVLPQLPPVADAERLAQVIDLSLERLVREAERIAAGEIDPKGSATCHDVMRACAAFYGVTIADIKSHRRTARIAMVRHVAMYVAKQVTLRSRVQIGYYIGGRDHTTVIHGIRKIEALRQSDARLNDEIQLIIMRLSERFEVAQ